MSLISKCFKYQLLQNATDQEKKFSVTLFRQLEISKPFRAKIVIDEEIALHLSVEPKDIALEFVGEEAA